MPDDIDDRMRRVKLEHATRVLTSTNWHILLQKYMKNIIQGLLREKHSVMRWRSELTNQLRDTSWTCSLVKTYHYDKGIQRRAKGRDAGYNATVHRRVGYQHCGAFQRDTEDIQ